MKNEKEKKNITKSVKVSQNQYDIIMQRSAEKNMNFSEYMVDSAVHGQNCLTPQIAVKIQEIANAVIELTDRLPYSEYTTKESLQQKVTELDELFHVESSEEKHKKIMDNAGKIIEGAGAVWEFLK